MPGTVAIVGRPNVGKSTLFNRLTESQKAIVADISGITRDRHYGEVEWIGKRFTIIDTGGYVANTEDVFEKAIREQVNIAINEADCILFMVDNTCSITDGDFTFANLLRKNDKKVFVVANKVDNSTQVVDSNIFYKLGFGEIYCVSSITGSGTGELLDAIIAELANKSLDSNFLDNNIPKLAIVGRPNVGKSSLINALMGEERNIVTPIPGTTRDSIHSKYNAFGHEFILIDTAGLRKKSKVDESIEIYSGVRTIRSIEECDICLLMIDAQEGIGAQDINILHLAQRQKKGIIILVNKWDLVTKTTQTTKEYEQTIRRKTSPFTDYPIIFISALSKQRIFKALETASLVFKNRTKRITTNKLNEILLPVIENSPPPTARGRLIKIKYITQLQTYTPSFAFFCNQPDQIIESYKRFLENKLRENFDFHGVPISINFRKK